MLYKSFVQLSFLFIALSIGASPVEQPRDGMTVHDSRDAPPAGFISVGPAPADAEINIQIALVSNDIPGLENAIYDVSTPTSPNYRKFLSIEQVSLLYILH